MALVAMNKNLKKTRKLKSDAQNFDAQSGFDTPNKDTSPSSPRATQNIGQGSQNMDANPKPRLKYSTTLELPYMKMIDAENENAEASSNDRANFLKLIGNLPNPNVLCNRIKKEVNYINNIRSKTKASYIYNMK